MCHLILLLPLIALPVFWVWPLSWAVPAYALALLISGSIYCCAMAAMHRDVSAGRESVAHEIKKANGMMSVKRIVMAGTSLGALALLGVAHAQMGMMGGRGMMGGPGMMGMATLRHQYFMQYGIPPKYADQVDPLPDTAANVSAGKKLYEASCASCHGPSGLGNGPAGQALNPPPANIAATSQMPMATDGYLYWTIAEGGAPLHSAMPAFKDTLKPDAIWQIILYLRQL